MIIFLFCFSHLHSHAGRLPGLHIFVKVDFIFFKQANNGAAHKEFADFRTFGKA